MYSPSGWKKYMILFMLIYLWSSVNAQYNTYECAANGNYTKNSAYSANLKTLLSVLYSNMSDYGYYTSSVGQSPNTANGFALCRADQSLDKCRACLNASTIEVLQRCPNQREAIMWYEYCTLRYSNDRIDRIQTDQARLLLYNTQNVTGGYGFEEERARLLLLDLAVKAAGGTRELKVGVGTKNYSDSDTIYGLAQCRPDFSLEACSLCLNQLAQGWKNYVSMGFRVLGFDCNIRYELVPFYNETRLMELGVQLPPPPPPPPPPNKKNDYTTKVIIVVVIVGVTLVFAAGAIIFMRKRIKRRRAYEIAESQSAADDISTVKSLQYDFIRIRAATNDFDNANKLGEGGFGAVYKGRLQGGDEVAVKRLSNNSGQGNTEFKNEVLLVAKLQHRNLVRLLGFAVEGRERVLVYEFVQNASLDQFIFDPIKRSLLDSETRYKIIGGTAKGILYLHEDSRLKIIHRDLKASNVLLDGDMNPKIADFGLARLFKQDETQANTSRIVGTYGYMSPEYAMHGEFSIKSDVFSFGVIVLEILSGMRNVYIRNGEHVEDLLTLTWKNWRDGTVATIIDSVLRNEEGSIRDMVRCIHIGLLCVQENAANRPTMASVVRMLGSSTMTLPIPSEPAFYMASRFRSAVQQNNSKETGVSSEGSSTQNNVSITELHPR